ncbi:MAG TPA: hypothetical protein VMU29_07225 [Smithella sp.]|nr:hypothetical protein [Smithella sp.]
MKKALWYIVGAIFLLSTLTFAAEKTISPAGTEPVKTNVVKPTRMHATGKVVEISDESIKIERTVKGAVENMEFALDKPFTDIVVNDSVKIAYTEKDGKLIATRVVKVVLKKKDAKASEAKPATDKK